jgi:hypothetical protein
MCDSTKTAENVNVMRGDQDFAAAVAGLRRRWAGRPAIGSAD